MATAYQIETAKKLAQHVGLKLIEQHDARSGCYRVMRGRDVLHHSDSLPDVEGFMLGWLEHVA